MKSIAVMIGLFIALQLADIQLSRKKLNLPARDLRGAYETIIVVF